MNDMGQPEDKHSRCSKVIKYLLCGVVAGTLFGGVVMIVSEGSLLFSADSSLFVVGSRRAWLPVMLIVYLGAGAILGVMGGVVAALLLIPR